MGHPASRAKTKWNAAHYKQIKISVDPDLAATFKAECEAANVSMAGELSRFMSEYCAVAKKRNMAASDDVSTRRKRRKTVTAIARKMEQVRDAEMRYCDNVPENLRGSVAYESTEESISKMDEVIDLLETIY